MLSSALIGARRIQSSTLALTRITLTTLTQLGTTIAAAKYGMKPIEPVAERGSKKLNNSAATARPQRIRASVRIVCVAPGALRYRTNVQISAVAATPAT